MRGSSTAAHSNAVLASVPIVVIYAFDRPDAVKRETVQVDAYSAGNDLSEMAGAAADGERRAAASAPSLRANS